MRNSNLDFSSNVKLTVNTTLFPEEPSNAQAPEHPLQRRECEVIAYASVAKDLPKLLCDARKSVMLMVEEEDDSDEEAGEVACTGKVALKGATPAGFEANGAIIASIGALVQKAIANAPALIAEIQTLAPEIEALIALFGKTTPTAA